MAMALFFLLSCTLPCPAPGDSSSGQLPSGLRWHIEEKGPRRMSLPVMVEITLEIAAGERGDEVGDGRAVSAGELARVHLAEALSSCCDQPIVIAEVETDRTIIHLAIPRGNLDPLFGAIASLLDGRALPPRPIEVSPIRRSALLRAHRCLLDALDPLPSLSPRGGDPTLRSGLDWASVEGWRRRWHRPCRSSLRIEGALLLPTTIASFRKTLASIDPGERLEMPSTGPLPATDIPFPPRLGRGDLGPFVACGWRLPPRGKKRDALIERLVGELPSPAEGWPGHLGGSARRLEVLVLAEPLRSDEAPAEALLRLERRLLRALTTLDLRLEEDGNEGWQRLRKALTRSKGMSIFVTGEDSP
ncbi:MAG TPA: hypothetical protein EYN79_09010 [Planctomycetes bacterium]|nr:hypothetical protein [Planctomycetota bacterium]HIN80731.1 hypothetical protein [Planctomycetota bacterium]